MSRKVTKFVTKVTLKNTSALAERADNFVKSVRDELEEFPRILVNTDQSPIQMEASYGRSLAIIGKIQLKFE